MARIRAYQAWLAASAAPLGACEAPQPATEIVVVVDSDLRVGSELTELQVQVFDREGSGAPVRSLPFALSAGGERATTHTLPLSFAVVAAKQNSRRDFRLVVTGRGHLASSAPETDVVEQQVITSFRPASALRLDVFLARTCFGVTHLCRDEAGERQDRSCVVDTGECRSVPVVSSLPEVVPGTDLGGYTRDAGLDAGTPSAVRDAAADAQMSEADAGTVESDAGGSGSDASIPPVDASEPDTGAPDTGAPDTGAPDTGTPDASVDGGPTASECPAGWDLATDGSCVPTGSCLAIASTACRADFPCEPIAAGGFTCRGELADWTMPDSVNGGQGGMYYTASATGTSVHDDTTGLVWERGIPAGTLTYAEALDHCARLSSDGYTDWRLPSIMELYSLLDVRRVEPSIAVTSSGRDLFIDMGMNTEAFWTSTLADAQRRFTMGFYDLAEVRGRALPSESRRVRCVHSERLVAAGDPETRFVWQPVDYRPNVNFEISMDHRTGLIWQAAPDPNTLLAREPAAAYCAGLGGGFRLPGLKELLTLVDIARTAPPYVLSRGVKGFAASTYVTDMLDPRTGSQLVGVVDFSTGAPALASSASTHHVVCVASSVN